MAVPLNRRTGVERRSQKCTHMYLVLHVQYLCISEFFTFRVKHGKPQIRF